MSTLDLANLPRTDGSEVDFAQDFFGREAFLTVSRQLNVEAYCLALTKVYTFGPTFRADKPAYGRVLDDRAGNRLRRPLEQWALAGALLRYTLTALLKEREDDPAFFDQASRRGWWGNWRRRGAARSSAAASAKSSPRCWMSAWRSAASTRTRTPGTAISGAATRYRMPALGLGFERTLAYVTGPANVRDAIPFPRTPSNARY